MKKDFGKYNEYIKDVYTEEVNTATQARNSISSSKITIYLFELPNGFLINAYVDENDNIICYHLKHDKIPEYLLRLFESECESMHITDFDKFIQRVNEKLS